MKRNISSNNNNRNVNASQSKRLRSNTAVFREEAVDHNMHDESTAFSSQKKVKMATSKITQQTQSGDDINGNTYSNISTSTPSRSSISFLTPSSSTDASSSKGTSSSVSKGTSSSLSKGPSSLSSKFNKKSGHTPFSSSQLQENLLHSPHGTANGSKLSENNSQKKISATERKKLGPLDTNSMNNLSQLTVPKPLPSASSNTKNQTNTQRKSSQHSTANRYSGLNQDSPLSSSFPSNNSNSSKLTTLSIPSLVEGSLEYRELKRMYLDQKNQTDEWRKDYQVLKKQLAHLKSSTIPRPTAEVLEWLHELIDLMNNNGIFRGDGCSLETIGEDLDLDKTSLVTVAARTPQKSALKLFRLLYPTVSSRARCISIGKMSKQQLDNIYLYVCTLHHNLSFTTNNLRKAIGTSIRSAKCELRKLQRLCQQQSNEAQNENINHDEINESTDAMETTLNETDDITDDEEIDEEGVEGIDVDEEGVESIDVDDGDNDGEVEQEDDDEQANGLTIDEEGSEDDE